MLTHRASQETRSFAVIANELVAFRNSSKIHGNLHEVTFPQCVPPFPTLYMDHGSLNTALERDGAGGGRGREEKERKGRGGGNL